MTQVRKKLSHHVHNVALANIELPEFSVAEDLCQCWLLEYDDFRSCPIEARPTSWSQSNTVDSRPPREMAARIYVRTQTPAAVLVNSLIKLATDVIY